MTKRERAQVVELLRCAADQCTADSVTAMSTASEDLGYVSWDPVYSFAWDVRAAQVGTSPAGMFSFVPAEIYRGELLEAAQRVEDGEWP